MTVIKRKLIEVALPLEAINRESAREKSIRQGHPSTLHLWWARRPLAACRAVLFAQLVDDPSSHPDLFPSEDDQAEERRRLFDLLERLVIWENINDEELLSAASAEIANSNHGHLPAVLDPFAGGGSIPLEAQRLGLDAYASDLNPVAILINKALIEIPPNWAGREPTFPGAAEQRLTWPGVTGLSEDIRRYGDWMRTAAQDEIGELYPSAELPNGGEGAVVAWLWARTISCPSPACGADIPLVSSWWLSKKKGQLAWIQPIVEGARITFGVSTDVGGPPDPPKRGQGANFSCLVCSALADRDYVHDRFRDHSDRATLLAVVAKSGTGRVFLPPTSQQIAAAIVERPEGVLDQECRGTFGGNAQGRRYGFDTFADYFTNRQLTALNTYAQLVTKARDRAVEDAERSGMPRDGSQEYGNAIALYLGLAVSRLSDIQNSLCRWENTKTQVRNLFARQAIPMVWDFAEAGLFSGAAGDFAVSLNSLLKALDRLPAKGVGVVTQANALTVEIPAGTVVCTDPPYYDNIGYADLADFFYVWLRQALGGIYPEETGTMLTPKGEELIASVYRFEGSRARADEHFERGFVETFKRIRESQTTDVPVTIFYAFKQSEQDDEGIASTGWETMLNGLLEAGLTVTATWPMRTELSNRMVGAGTNALASSIVLACRPRSVSAEAVSRRIFIGALKNELPRALKDLQQGSVAPVDMAQAAIGPGMAVYSRFSRVSEADGSVMGVRTALALINQVLDEVLSEQEGDFDPETRFCVKWFAQFGWNEAVSGEADVLSRAVNTSVAVLERGGVFRAAAGKARLIEPGEMAADWDPSVDKDISVWEVSLRVAYALQEQGSTQAGEWINAARSRVDLDAVKELTYLLYSICEKKGWTDSAILFNGLGTSWSDLNASARLREGQTAKQGELELDGDDDQ